MIVSDNPNRRPYGIQADRRLLEYLQVDPRQPFRLSSAPRLISLSKPHHGMFEFGLPNPQDYETRKSISEPLFLCELLDQLGSN